MSFTNLVSRWVRAGFDIHRIWLILEHVAMCRRTNLEDLMISDGNADTVAENVIKERQITGVGLPIMGIDPTEKNLREMGIGELLDVFDRQYEGDATGSLEPAVNALISILQRIAAVYDDNDGLRECAWALGIASGVLEASLEETMDQEAAETITRNIAGLANFLLMVEGSQNLGMPIPPPSSRPSATPTPTPSRSMRGLRYDERLRW